RSRSPMTLEGCVVKFADTIAYIGRDLQDARDVGLIDDGTKIPEQARNVLGSSNREIINTLIYDLLENSDTEESGFISYSRIVEQALISLRTFSREHIYNNPTLTSERRKIELMYTTLFSSYLESLENNDTTAKIYTDFINTQWTNQRYLETAIPPELVRDFIAGMTDRYFAKRYEEFVIPRRIEGKFR
ncbi:MAG: phosphohydrolase, partial [Methanoregula sp.]|nr:phosphohydrolase [Methanoregula sp.]